MATAKTLQDVGSALLTGSPLEKAVAKNTVKHKAPLPKGKGVATTTSIRVLPVIAYPINKLPTWTKPSSGAAYSQTTDRGYDIEAMRLNEVRRALAMAFANGVLSTGMDPSSDTKLSFFVTGVSIDWALAGSTAQSRLTRDFYPHNFTQATFTVQGISLNQYEYGEMVEFIHQAQHDALNGGNLIQLNIFNSNPNPGQPGPLDGGRQTVKRGVRTTSQVIGDLNIPNQIIRGHHSPITCQGYVSSMQRKHQKGVFVPTWQFSFTVSVMLEGPYKEKLHNLTKQKNWVDMVKSVSIFQTNWLAQNNQAALDWVRRESVNIFNVTQTATGSSVDSSTSGTPSPPSAPSGDSKQLAKSILDSGKVTYSGRLVQSDLQAAADGRPGSAGAMQNKEILQLIAAIAAKHTVDISALQSGGTGHTTGSDHYKGNAVDFDQLDGVSITGRNTPAVTIMTIAMSVMSGGWFGQSGCGPTPTLPAGWTTGTDTCNHLHISFR